MHRNDVGFLFSYKAQKWAHSELCNHFCNAVDEQKDKPVWYVYCWLSPYIVQSIEHAADGVKGRYVFIDAVPQDLPKPVHTGLALDFCFTAASFASPDCMTPELAAPQTDTVELTA